MNKQSNFFSNQVSKPPDQHLKIKKTIHIAVTGEVSLTDTETKIIDTKEFQRLRGLKQLGTSYLVYPSATHTRFEHSLGTLAAADQFIQALRYNKDHFCDAGSMPSISDEEIIIIRLAALLHDIGNLPFGHTLEDDTKVIETNQDDKGRLELLLNGTSTIGRVIKKNLSDDILNRLIAIMSTKKDDLPNLKEHAYIVDIYKNTLCADLIDYVQRDSLYCGLPCQISKRFLRYLRIHESNDGVRRLAVKIVRSNFKKRKKPHREPLVNDLIQLLRYRYSIGERVYYHHAKQAADAMIATAYYLSRYEAKGNNLEEKNLIMMNDYEFLIEIYKRGDSKSKELIEAIMNRHLYKRFFMVQRNDFDGHNSVSILKKYERLHNDPKTRRNQEQVLSAESDLADTDILLHSLAPDMNFKLAEMNVITDDEALQKLEDTGDELKSSQLKALKESHKSLWALRCFIKPKYLGNAYKTKMKLLNTLCQYHCIEKYQLTENTTISDIVRDMVSDLSESMPQANYITQQQIKEFENSLSNAFRSTPNSETNIRAMVEEYIKQNVSQNEK